MPIWERKFVRTWHMAGDGEEGANVDKDVRAYVDTDRDMEEGVDI